MSAEVTQGGATGAGASSRVGVERASRWRMELGLVGSLWRRDLLRLWRERSRWIGVVLQPLLFWGLIGSGMGESFVLVGHEEVGYVRFFYPGVLVMVVLFTTIFATMSVIEDRASGYMQGVLVAPGSSVSLVLGKVSGVTSMAGIEVAIFLALAPAAGYPLGEVAWGSLVLVLVLLSVGLTSMNLMVAWWMRSTGAYHAIMSVVLLPLWVLSGAMFPPAGALSGVMSVNPMSYGVDGVRAALSGGEASGLVGVSWGGAVWVLLGFAVLCLMGAVAVVGRSRGGRR